MSIGVKKTGEVSAKTYTFKWKNGQSKRQAPGVSAGPRPGLRGAGGRAGDAAEQIHRLVDPAHHRPGLLHTSGRSGGGFGAREWTGGSDLQLENHRISFFRTTYLEPDASFFFPCTFWYHPWSRRSSHVLRMIFLWFSFYFRFVFVHSSLLELALNEQPLFRGSIGPPATVSRRILCWPLPSCQLSLEGAKGYLASQSLP